MFNTSKYKDTTDCFELDKQIELIKNEVNYHSQNFNKNDAQQGSDFLYKKQALKKALNCQDVLDADLLNKTTSVLDKYNQQAETVIVGQSVKTRNLYFFIAASTLILSAIIIVSNSKKI